jgi:glutaredoxin
MYPTIYVSDTCPSCGNLKQVLQARRVPYIEKNVSQDQRAYLELLATGSRSIPTMVVNGHTVIGSPEIQRALGL